MYYTTILSFKKALKKEKRWGVCISYALLEEYQASSAIRCHRTEELKELSVWLNIYHLCFGDLIFNYDNGFCNYK